MEKISFEILPVTLFRQNCSVLLNKVEKIGTVVDPGGDVDKILDMLRKHDIKIDKIVLTHGHIDHAGGASELAKILGVKILGPHQDDKFLLEAISSERGRYVGMFEAQNCSPDVFLVEGQTVEMAGMPFKVLHCPGHTPGHVVFVNCEIRLGILGDVLFHGSVGRTDFPYSDHQALMDSIRTKIMALEDDTFFISGHGPSSTIGYERLHNPFVRQALEFSDGVLQDKNGGKG